MKKTRDRLYQGLIYQFNQNNHKLITRNGDEQYSLPNTLNLSFRGIDAKKLIKQLRHRLAFSIGNACHEDTTLQAIGMFFTFIKLNQIFLFYSIQRSFMGISTCHDSIKY